MKIGLNATCLTTRSSGANQRFKGIYGSLFRQMPEAEFVVYEPGDCEIRCWFPKLDNVEFVKTHMKSENRLQKFVIGRGYWASELKRRKFDVFECFNLPSIHSNSSKNILTVHDIRDLEFKRNWIERTAFKILLDRTIARTDCIITVSNTARQEILKYYPDANIAVVYNGVKTEEFSSVDLPEARAQAITLGIDGEYVLCVGHFEPRKNYSRLIEAIAIASRKRNRPIKLVLVGNDSGELANIRRCALALGVDKHVSIFLGLSDFEVRCLYKAARMMVFPSLYEGFGIPILEGMAAGIPISTSDIPVFKEITENCGSYFDPRSPESIADSLISVIESEAERARLVAYGDKRVQDFRFSHLADQVRALYRGYS